MKSKPFCWHCIARAANVLRDTSVAWFKATFNLEPPPDVPDMHMGIWPHPPMLARGPDDAMFGFRCARPQPGVAHPGGLWTLALRDFSTTAKHALLLWRRVGCMRPPHAPRTETAFSIVFCKWCTVCVDLPCVSRGLNFATDKSWKCEKYFKKSYGGRNVGNSFPTEIRREFYLWKRPSLPGVDDIRIFIRNYVERNLPIGCPSHVRVAWNKTNDRETPYKPQHNRSHKSRSTSTRFFL